MKEDLRRSQQLALDAALPSRSTGIVQQEPLTTIGNARIKITYTNDLQSGEKSTPDEYPHNFIICHAAR